MKASFPVVAWLFVIASFHAIAVEASVIDPTQSEVPACLVACPSGDVVNDFVMRDFVRNPRQGAVIQPDFCGCPNFHLVIGGSPPYIVQPSGCEIVEYTDEAGVARLPIQGAGSCAELPIYIYGWGWPAPYPVRSIASTDQDGNEVVDSRDLAIVQAAVGTNDRTADFDGDGAVTATDVEYVRGHLGHRSVQALDVPLGTAAGVGFSRPPAPNPSRGTVHFSVVLGAEQDAEVGIFDLRGRRVAALWKGRLGSGETRFRWNGVTTSGERAAAGIYVVRLRAGGRVESRLLTVLR
jgi:hypothetical protein